MARVGEIFVDTWIRRLSIGFAVALAIVQFIYNWISPVWWPFIVVEYISVALLLYGAFFSPTILAAGWGFACANFYRAFFVSWGTSGLSWVLVGLTLLFGISMVGLALIIVTGLRQQPDKGEVESAKPMRRT